MAKRGVSSEKKIQLLSQEIRELEEKAKVEEDFWHSVCGDEDPFEYVTKLIARCSEAEDSVAEFKGLIEAHEKLFLKLKAKLEALTSPPLPYGYVMRILPDRKVDVAINGKRTKMGIVDEIDISKLKIGQRVVLAGGAILEVDGEWENTGEEAKVSALLSDEIVRVAAKLDEIQNVILAEPMRDQKVREGDTLLINGQFAFAKRPKSKEVEQLFLAEMPITTYEDIGGLDEEIKRLKELIEWPYLYQDYYLKHGLVPPKGILLFGPPGCGKTLIAKAIANALGRKTGGRAYFMNIKGPELLSKWVGQTEQYIREVFGRAKELATENLPVIVFFDEMDALFPIRGSQISTDTAGTIVPQFTTEMDGIEGLKNVIVVGATNRQDRIDPAVIRPGRFDHKIEINRPKEAQTIQILRVYLKPQNTVLHPQYFDPNHYEGDDYIPRDREGKPRHKDNDIEKYPLAKDSVKIIDYLIDRVVKRIFDPKKELNQLIEINYRSGRKQILYTFDFNSGAVIEAIVKKAKLLAFRDFIESNLDPNREGLSKGHLLVALEEEFASQEKLPSIANPHEWANIFGLREEVSSVRSLVEERKTSGNGSLVGKRQRKEEIM